MRKIVPGRTLRTLGVVATLAFFAPLPSRAAPRLEAKMTGEQMREILTHQPDFTAELVLENGEQHFLALPMGRVARKGHTYRLEPGSLFRQRTAGHDELPLGGSVWLVRMDRQGGAPALTVLVPSEKRYAVLDPDRPDENGYASTVMLLLLAMPYAVLLEDILMDPEMKLTEEGDAMVDEHPCTKIRAEYAHGKTSTCYVARDLGNLVVKISVEDSGGEWFNMDGLTATLRGVSLGVDDRLFTPPADYRRDDSLRVELAPGEELQRNIDREAPDAVPEGPANSPPVCATASATRSNAPRRCASARRLLGIRTERGSARF